MTGVPPWNRRRRLDDGTKHNEVSARAGHDREIPAGHRDDVRR
jgi:hypothetical protein